METLNLSSTRELANYILTALFALGFFLLLIACGGHRPGIYHQVKPGDTIYKIAREYNVSPLEIARANNIKDLSSSLKEDTVLFIPGATKPKEPKEKKSSPSPSPPPPQRKEEPAEKKSVPPPERKEKVEKPPEPKDEPKSDTSLAKGEKRLFIWPYQGEITNTFGPQPGGMFYNHIRIEGRDSDPVLAAAAGTVIFSASLKEFGETVILKHDRGFTTVYTYLGTRTVKIEEKVPQGKKIGTPRPTGKDGKAFIHFELRENTKPINPLPFLPPKRLTE
ncbi:MAG: peptidoglycan DD-metalloendopeptidase family protein [Syntrophales bacterium]|nr:peptidoglycan DD-metalloendopeptidase family protein [Syntrophales bacterium]